MFSKVYIEITNICNMSCSFCHGHKRSPRRMTREEFSLILNKLQGHTKYIYYHLMGEPLTHPCLTEFIKMAGECGYKSIITTNGTLLDKRGEGLIESGIHKINVSLHSFESGSDEDYERYVCNITDFAKKASDKGIIVVIRLWNKGFDEGRNARSLELIRNNIDGEWKENTRGIRIREKLFLEWGDRFEWPDREAEFYGEKVSCYGMRDQFGILCDGTVLPCCLDSDGIINLGNVFYEDLTAILNSKRATDIKKGFECRHATEDLCKRCGYAQRFSK